MFYTGEKTGTERWSDQWVNVPLFSMGGRSLCFLDDSQCLPCLVFLSLGDGDDEWCVQGGLYSSSAPRSSSFPQSAHLGGRKPGWWVLPHQTRYCARSFRVLRRKLGRCNVVVTWSEPQQGRMFVLLLDGHFHHFCSSHFSFLMQLMRPIVCSESGKESDPLRATP